MTFVDGGKNAGDFSQAGADVLETGGPIFSAEDKRCAIDELRSAKAWE